jgi:hypothetical protein
VDPFPETTLGAIEKQVVQIDGPCGFTLAFSRATVGPNASEPSTRATELMRSNEHRLQAAPGTV